MKKKLPFIILIVYLLQFFVGFYYSSTVFIQLELKTEFGISSTLMATITSINLITGLLMTFVFSRILDHIDIKVIMVTGAVIQLTGILLSPLSNGPMMTAFAYVISGIGSNILMASPYPAVMLVDPENNAKHVNIEQGALSFGAFVSPLIMALLINTFELNWRVVYYIGAVFLGVMLVMILMVKSPGKSDDIAKEEETEEEKAERKKIIWTPAFVCMGFTLVFYMLIESGILNYSKDYFEVLLNDTLSASLCISAIRGGMTLSRWFGDKVIKSKVKLTGLSLLLPSLALLLMGIIAIPKLSLLWTLLFGIFSGPCWPLSFSMGLSLDEKSSGKLSSILFLYNNIGNNLGNIFTGFLVDNIGVKNAFLIDGTIGALGIIIFMIGIRSFKKMGKDPEMI
jgi:MFS family permease